MKSRVFTYTFLFLFHLSFSLYSQNERAYRDLNVFIYIPSLLDSVAENFYHQNDPIALDPGFYRMLADNTYDETRSKWCIRFLNFIEDNRGQYYHYYGEANWRLGDCFLTKDSKFSKLYYDRAIDFYETKPNLYLEHIGFLLSIFKCGLYRPELILKGAQNLALKNNDAIQSGRILIFQITHSFGINDLKNAELKINELEKFSWSVKDDLQAEMQFYGIFFKAILRIKQNKDISSERSYLLKHHERLNITNYQNIFEFIDEVDIYCKIIGEFDPVAKMLYNNALIYSKENFHEFSHERLYFEYSYSNYLINTEHLEEAFEICNKNVLIAKEMMYSDMASKYEAMINSIYIQQGNMMEYSLNSGFGDINYKQDGSFSVDYTTKNYFQVRAYRKADDIDKIKYLDHLYGLSYLWRSTKYNKSWLKGIKRDVNQLLGKNNLYYSGALKYLAYYYYSEDKCAKGLKLLRKGLKIDLGIYDNLSEEYINAQEQLIPFLISEKKYSELDTLFIYLANQKKSHLEKIFLSFNPVELLMFKENHERFYGLMVNYSHFRGFNKKFIVSMNDYWTSLNGLSNSKNIWMLNEIKKDEKYISAYSKLKDLQKKLFSIEKNDYLKSIEYKTINDSLKRIQNFLEHEVLNNQLSFEKNDKTKNKLGDYSFAEFNFVNISKVEYFDFTSNKWTDSIKYLVFIINSSDTLVDHFFIEKGLELEKELLNDYKTEASDKSKATDLKNEIFYNSFWKPIADKIGDDKTVYVSLGGVYNNINLNTLYNPETGKYLIEEKDIRIVNM